MSIVLLLVYFIVCIAMVTWGIWKKDRYFQFPTISGAIWLFVLGPQMISAVLMPSKYPASAIRDHGIEIAITMCILCTLAGWLGYIKKPRFVSHKFTSWSNSRILLSGVLLYAIGFVAVIMMTQYFGGFSAYFMGGEYYQDIWSGALVKYKFFSKLTYAGLLLTLFSYLIRPTIPRLILSGIFMIYPLCVVAFLGRRGPAFAVLLTVVTSMFFIRKWTFPRWVVVIFMVLIGLFSIVWPKYRELTSSGQFDKLKDINIKETYFGRLSNKPYEFDITVVTSAAVAKELNLSLGTGIYNGLVRNLIPRQIVGEKIKQSLFLKQPLEGRSTIELYGWEIPHGSTVTGPASVFWEFWFFGCLVFFFVGHAYRYLWEAAKTPGNYGYQIIYVCFLWQIPSLVMAGFSSFVGSIVYTFIPLLPFILYIKHKRNNRRAILYSDSISNCIKEYSF